MAGTVTAVGAGAGQRSASAQTTPPEPPTAPRPVAPILSQPPTAEPLAPEPWQQIESRPSSTSILLVDDDESSLRALRSVLEPLGQRMLTARSGEEALRRLLREEFAVILLDMRMPGLDGLQTASYINARARTRHVPIIFLTAHAEDVGQVFKAYAAGAVDYVVKPFDPDVLRSKVAVFVALQHERELRVREAQARARAEAVAATLQRHLLPDRLPQLPALAMAARYRPSERVAQVGGDWYDAIELPGGGIGLVIGDVVGHGVHAATLMGELRAALRAYAVAEPRSPAAVLGALNALVACTHGERMVATLLYMVIDEGSLVRFASAGHLPPLLMDADGSSRFLEHRRAPPLGAEVQIDFTDWEGRLDPGSTVLLYTDGLVERRGEAIDVGLERLREALLAGPSDLERLCTHVLECAAGDREAQDDIALLAVRLSGARESAIEGALELELPAEPASVPVARHEVERWLAQAGGGGDDVFAIKLAVSETCANAVEHAYDSEPGHSFRVRAERASGEVKIEVSDSGRWRAPRGSGRGMGLRMVEQLMDAVDVERSSAGTTVRMSKAPARDERL